MNIAHKAKFVVELTEVTKWKTDDHEVSSYSSHVSDRDFAGLLDEAKDRADLETFKNLPATFKVSAVSEKEAVNEAIDLYNMKYRQGELVIAEEMEYSVTPDKLP